MLMVAPASLAQEMMPTEPGVAEPVMSSGSSKETGAKNRPLPSDNQEEVAHAEKESYGPRAFFAVVLGFGGLWYTASARIRPSNGSRGAVSAEEMRRRRLQQIEGQIARQVKQAKQEDGMEHAVGSKDIGSYAAMPPNYDLARDAQGVGAPVDVHLPEPEPMAAQTDVKPPEPTPIVVAPTDVQLPEPAPKEVVPPGDLAGAVQGAPADVLPPNSQPAAPVRLKFRFVSDGQTMELEVQRTWTMATLTEELLRHCRESRASLSGPPPSIDLVHGGRVLGRKPELTVSGAKLDEALGAVVLVLERKQPMSIAESANAKSPPESSVSSRQPNVPLVTRDDSGSGSSAEDSGDDSSSGSGSGHSDDAEIEAALASFGVSWPPPAVCRMNEAVEKSPKKLPEELLSRLPWAPQQKKLKKLSDGWHEGYELSLQPGGPVKRVFCRIWRSQLGYFRLQCPVGHAVEERAMALARAAGLPTPEILLDRDGLPLAGTCNRGDGTATDFAVYRFIEGAVSERKAPHAISRTGPIWRFELGLMAKLHDGHPGPHEATRPLARFDNWREHLDYLEALATRSSNQLAPTVADVRLLFEVLKVPDLPPALCHLDWHLGNVLVGQNGELLAVLDWEFAGIGDPRFDLIRYIRRHRFTGDGDRCRQRKGGPSEKELWTAYGELRFGSGSAERLGPMSPWMALECLAVMVFASAVCARVGSGTYSSDPGDANHYVPRCDILEWMEDMQTSVFHLRRMGLAA